MGRRSGKVIRCGVRIAECGMRNASGSVVQRTTFPCDSAFRIPHSALVSPAQHTPPVHIQDLPRDVPGDRKSTRLNSSHLVISYAVFCLKKKPNTCAL